MNSIIIKKLSKHAVYAHGSFKYWHIIAFPDNSYGYDINMTDEGMNNLIEALENTGNKVVFKVEES